MTASALLLICSAVFLRSTMAAATVDPGIRTEDVILVSVLNEQMRGTVLEAVKSDPSIVSVAASWPGGLGGPPALAGGATGTSSITYQYVSPEYFGVLGIDIVRGRGFTITERSANSAVAIVSDSAARQLWPGADAVGRSLRLEPDPQGETRDSDAPPFLSRTVVVVGVARDVPGFRLGGVRRSGAGVYVPIDADAAKTALTLRVQGDPERARRALLERLSSIDDNLAEIATMRSLAGLEAFLLAIPFWLTLVLAALALVLTLSGLFGVLSYLVEQRAREIGVRIALGATNRDIAALVLSQSAGPVAIGLLVGGTLTAALGGAIMATPAAEALGAAVRLFDPIAYAASVLCIVAACACAGLVPALRAGRIDPVAALRQD